MRRTFYVFPSGWSGIALLLLRISIALLLIAVPIGRVSSVSWPALALDLLALVLIVGLRTRIAALLACIVAIGMIVTAGAAPSLSCFAHTLEAIVLTLAGPGAYSVDARLFGRLTVRL